MPFEQPTPRPFTATAIQAYAPAASGVYGISNAREWIYIGRADDIQSALLDHLQDSHAPLMKRQPAGFVFEVCERSRQAARQDRLVLEYGPTCNRQSAGNL